MVEGAGDSDDSANFTLLIIKRLLGGGRPVHEAIASRNEFDPIDDRLSGLENSQIVFANVFKNVGRDIIVVLFADNLLRLGSVEDFAQTLVVSDVSEVGIFDEIDKARKVVKDGCEVIFDLIRLEKSVVLHEESE